MLPTHFYPKTLWSSDTDCCQLQMTEEMCIAWLQENIFFPCDCSFYCKPYCSKEQTTLLLPAFLFLKVSLISS